MRDRDLTEPTGRVTGDDDRPAGVELLSTVEGLLRAIETLPEPDREVARARVDLAVSSDAHHCRLELGLLALDLVPLLAERAEVAGTSRVAGTHARAALRPAAAARTTRDRDRAGTARRADASRTA